jgi:hypothetical protein
VSGCFLLIFIIAALALLKNLVLSGIDSNPAEVGKSDLEGPLLKLAKLFDLCLLQKKREDPLRKGKVI